jgi:hypothetical protein
LLNPTDWLPQEPSLLVKELVQGDEVGYHMVQKIFLVAASF